jgi:hypothetical protein
VFALSGYESSGVTDYSGDFERPVDCGTVGGDALLAGGMSVSR